MDKSENNYLELSTHPVRFEAVNQMTNVFFDDSKKQVNGIEYSRMFMKSCDQESPKSSSYQSAQSFITCKSECNLKSYKCSTGDDPYHETGSYVFSSDQIDLDLTVNTDCSLMLHGKLNCYCVETKCLSCKSASDTLSDSLLLIDHGNIAEKSIGIQNLIPKNVIKTDKLLVNKQLLPEDDEGLSDDTESLFFSIPSGGNSPTIPNCLDRKPISCQTVSDTSTDYLLLYQENVQTSKNLLWDNEHIGSVDETETCFFSIHSGLNSSTNSNHINKKKNEVNNNFTETKSSSQTVSDTSTDYLALYYGNLKKPVGTENVIKSTNISVSNQSVLSKQEGCPKISKLTSFGPQSKIQMQHQEFKNDLEKLGWRTNRPKMYHCFVCGKEYACFKSCKKHMFEHQKQTHVCPFCSKSYRLKCHLTQHINRAH